MTDHRRPAREAGPAGKGAAADRRLLLRPPGERGHRARADGPVRRPDRRQGPVRDGAGLPAPQREHAGQHLGRVAAARGRRTARRRGRPAGGGRRPRADDQPAPQPTRRPGLRVLLGGPAAHRAARGGAGQGPAGPRGGRLPQAPGRQRGGDRPAHRRRPDRRGDAARGLPAAVRDRRRGREPVDADGRLQPRERRPRHRAGRRAQRRRQGRVVLRRRGGLRLVRHRVHGTGDQRRPRPRHARPDGSLGRRPGARRRGRRGRGVGRGRRRAPAPASGRAGRRLGEPRPRPADLPAPDRCGPPGGPAPVRGGRHDRAHQRRRAAARARHAGSR